MRTTERTSLKIVVFFFVLACALTPSPRERRRAHADARALTIKRCHARLVNSKAPPSAVPTATYTNLFGGVGEVRVLSLLPGESAPFTAVLSCELAPGGRVGAHMQQEFAELVIGVSGEGEARVNGIAQPLDAADAVYLPLGAALEIMNRSQHEPLRYLIVKARG